MTPQRLRTGAACFAVVGCVGTALVMTAMHIDDSESREANKDLRAEILMAREPPKPPPAKVERPKPPRPKNSRLDAPRPQLTASLAGLGTGLALFAPSDIANAGADLLAGDHLSKSMVMTEDAVDTPPRATAPKPPRYPPRARARGLSGFVRLRILVGPDGRVEKTRVVESQPEGVFDDAAKEAVMQWAFSPGRYQGEAVRVWAEQTVRFQLN